LLLLAVMALWVVSPLFWLYAVGKVGPDSNHDPTPEQARALRIVDWTWFCYVAIAPLSVLAAAWWTRRWVALILTLIAVVLGIAAAAWLFLLS
jgi:hypothetical protein